MNRNHRAMGRALKLAVRTDESYEILGKNGTWTAGGCWILAAALKRLLGTPSRLVAITRGRDDMPQHVLVELDGTFFDADGASTRGSLLRRWEAVEGVWDASLRPFDESMSRRARADGIPFSVRKAKRLAAYLACAVPSSRNGKTPTR